MGVNIQEEVADVLKTATDNFSFSRSNQGQNEEMAQAVNQYKRERTEFYNNLSIVNNPFSSATQTLWYQHFLHRKRLDRKGLRIRYENVADTRSQAEDGRSLPHFSYREDGKNVVCEIKDDAYCREVWVRGEQQVFANDTAGKKQQYYILSSKHQGERQYVCPNCGNVADVEAMIDGCDYCGTKFRLEDFKGKVSSCYIDRKGALSGGRDKNPVMLLLPLILGVMLLFGFFFMLMMGLLTIAGTVSGGIGGIVLLPVVGLLLLVGGIVCVALLIGGALLIGKKSEKEGVGRTTAVMQKIKAADSMFSKEFFIGNLMNKVESVHYAVGMDEVQAFFQEGTFVSIPDYSDVVDCELVDYVLTDFFAKDGFWVLDCELNLNLKCDSGAAVTERREKLKLSLVKKGVVTTVNDAVIFRCASCGDSLTLLNGGRCVSCGNGLNLIEYDWVFHAYEVVQ